MAKLSKAKKQDILQKNFPEFFKQCKELNDSLDAITFEVQEKIDKIYDIQERLEELEDEKINIKDDIGDL